MVCVGCSVHKPHVKYIHIFVHFGVCVRMDVNNGQPELRPTMNVLSAVLPSDESHL